MEPTAEAAFSSSNPSSPLQVSAAFPLIDSQPAAAAAAAREPGEDAASQGSPPGACGKAVPLVVRSISRLSRQRAAVSMVTVAAAAAAFAAAAPAAARESELSVGDCLKPAAAPPSLSPCISRAQTPPPDELPTHTDRAAAAGRSVTSKSSNCSNSSSRSSSCSHRSSSHRSSSNSRSSSHSRSRSSERSVHGCVEETDLQHSDTLPSSPLLQTLRSWDEAYCPPTPKLKPQAAPLDLLMEELLEEAHLLPSLTEAAAAAEACDAQQQQLLGEGPSSAPYGERLLPPDWGTMTQQWGSIPAAAIAEATGAAAAASTAAASAAAEA
ncbi:hypothetical protein Emed_004438 [Eimeria media]